MSRLPSRAVVTLVTALAGCSSASSPDAAGAGSVAEDAGAPGEAGPPTAPTGSAPGADASVLPDAAAGADAPPGAPGPQGDSGVAAPPPPAAYVTTDDLSLALSPVLVTVSAGGAGGAVDGGDVATISVDPTTTYQSIVGFGAAITDSSSYVMTRYLGATALQQTLARLFDPALGIGLSFLRQPMGASDFSSAGNFSYDDGAKDPSLANFAITQDLSATIPVLQKVLAIAPSTFIMATPWSPPAWMKNNASMNGTAGASGVSAGLAGDAYGPFGQYFAKFVQAYAAQGVPIRAITPQNEPLNVTASYPAMDLNAPSELALIAQDIAPAFASAKLTTQIWAYDHNWDVESYPEQVMADPAAGPATEGAAFHCYGGDPKAMSTFHAAYPTKSVYMTECSGGTWQADPFASTIDLAIDSTANWARAVALWNLALDDQRGPQNHGCNDCRGVVTVDRQSGAVTYEADFYALGHFSKFVRPGAVRVASQTASGALRQVAFRNADGRLALVAHNTGKTALTVAVTGAGGATTLRVDLPANAAVTLAWTPP